VEGAAAAEKAGLVEDLAVGTVGTVEVLGDLEEEAPAAEGQAGTFDMGLELTASRELTGAAMR
jgi:hypothetical protein